MSNIVFFSESSRHNRYDTFMYVHSLLKRARQTAKGFSRTARILNREYINDKPNIIQTEEQRDVEIETE